MPDEPATALGSTARHVAQIVAAAEQAATDLCAQAEQLADERIADAERAARLRVQAADDEAGEVRAEAEEEAFRMRSEAAEQTALERDRAHAQAREVLAEARAAARDVLREGEQLSGHLRELSDSLRVNAERLLRDVREAHGELTARLNRADPDHGRGPDEGFEARAAAAGARVAGLDVPEFQPRRRR